MPLFYIAGASILMANGRYRARTGYLALYDVGISSVAGNKMTIIVTGGTNRLLFARFKVYGCLSVLCVCWYSLLGRAHRANGGLASARAEQQLKMVSGFY